MISNRREMVPMWSCGFIPSGRIIGVPLPRCIKKALSVRRRVRRDWKEIIAGMGGGGYLDDGNGSK